MSRTTKVMGFSVPPSLVKEVEGLAKAERRTKSELFREMVRVYSLYRVQRQQQEASWIEALIAEVKGEEAKSPSSPEQIVEEAVQLARYGEQQARKLGITPKGINARIHAYRKTRKP